jgi:hypothetical protein
MGSNGSIHIYVKYLTFIFDLKKNCYIVEKKRQIANIVHNLRKKHVNKVSIRFPFRYVPLNNLLSFEMRYI